MTQVVESAPLLKSSLCCRWIGYKRAFLFVSTLSNKSLSNCASETVNIGCVGIIADDVLEV